MKSTTVTLTWTASTDNVGVVGYSLLRNGIEVARVLTTSATNSPGRGPFTYTVVAVGTAGNKSAASNAVTIKL